MIKWIKKLFYFKPYCPCPPHIDFREKVIKEDHYNEERLYICNKCDFVHQVWLYDGGNMYVNPAIRDYMFNSVLLKLSPGNRKNK